MTLSAQERNTVVGLSLHEVASSATTQALEPCALRDARGGWCSGARLREMPSISAASVTVTTNAVLPIAITPPIRRRALFTLWVPTRGRPNKEFRSRPGHRGSTSRCHETQGSCGRTKGGAHTLRNHDDRHWSPNVKPHQSGNVVNKPERAGRPCSTVPNARADQPPNRSRHTGIVAVQLAGAGSYRPCRTRLSWSDRQQIVSARVGSHTQQHGPSRNGRVKMSVKVLVNVLRVVARSEIGLAFPAQGPRCATHFAG
jgi:hypothetical protein